MLTATLIAVVLVFNTVLYTLFSHFGWQFSPISDDDLSISGSLDEIMREAELADRKITVIFCYPEKSVKEHETGAYVYRTAKEFESRYPNAIELKFVNIISNTDDKGEHFDVSKYAKDEEGRDIPIAKTSVIFTSGDNHKVLTDTATNVGYGNFYMLDYTSGKADLIAYNGEEVFASSMCWVLADEHKTAYLTRGHSESIDASFVNLLSAAGYNVAAIDLKKEEVPSDAALLVISAPRSDFEASSSASTARSETDRLRHYLEQGGKLFVTMNPLAKELPVFEGLLAEFGISLSYSENESGERAVNIVNDMPNSIVVDGYTFIAEYSDGEDGSWIENNVDKYSDGGVVIRDAAALELSGGAKPLLVASASAKIFAHGKEHGSLGGYAVAAYADIENEDGEDGRVVVVPSIYLTATSSIITNGYANRDFVLSVFERVYARELLPYGVSVITLNTTLLEGLTMNMANVYTALILSVPAVIAAVGAVILIRRKNR